MRQLQYLSAILLLVPCIAVACGSEQAATCGTDCAPAQDGGADVVVPAGCDPTKGVKDSPSCVDDGVGVFVSPTGDDGATGTKSKPVKSIAKGVELAASRGLPRVYVCEGTY